LRARPESYNLQNSNEPQWTDNNKNSSCLNYNSHETERFTFNISDEDDEDEDDEDEKWILTCSNNVIKMFLKLCYYY